MSDTVKVRGWAVELRRTSEGAEVYIAGEYHGVVSGSHGKWRATDWSGRQVFGFCATRNEAIGRLLPIDPPPS